MTDCVFCKIVAGEIPAEKIAESDDFVAILGIKPKFPGMTVIITKEHVGTYLYQTVAEELFTKMHLFAKKVALKLDLALGSFRCIQVMEGFDVDHAHLKLFPVYEGKFYDASYEGPEIADSSELRTVAEKIRKAGVN